LRWHDRTRRDIASAATNACVVRMPASVARFAAC
jgi:hypothetical protein